MNDLNHDLTFSAHTINCVCHSIRSMFRVLGMYNFGFLVDYLTSHWAWTPCFWLHAESSECWWDMSFLFFLIILRAVQWSKVLMHRYSLSSYAVVVTLVCSILKNERDLTDTQIHIYTYIHACHYYISTTKWEAQWARSAKNVKKPQTWCDCHGYGLWWFQLFF